ncbi:RNA polymerase sigma factor [Paludibacterium yongneupense]|uniref:RNA polymerase sigma factor n=1 Tax=Paludibacterium yongneupense TaxID=400061 RepID=UPI0003FB0CD4|nr:RNA polymerase sigma factor [Paludibacterium yongneupense]
MGQAEHASIKVRSAADRFECAWRAVQDNLLRKARRLCRGDAAQADELLADTALKACLYLRKQPEKVRDPEGFLFLVLNHVFLDHIRRLGRERTVFNFDLDIDADFIGEIASHTPGLELELELRQQLQQLDRALATLSPGQRDLFALKFEKELSYPVIAASLSISEALARKRVELLRRRLQTLLRTA